MEEDKFYDSEISMKRLKNKGRLIDDCSILFCGLAENREVLPKSFRKKCERTILRDFRIGIRIINKKIPVYIEMPELKSVGNGMYREVDSKTKEPINDEIHISAIDKQIEADMKKVIDYDEG